MNHDSKNNLIIYQAENGVIELRLDMDNETMWATIDQIAQIFEIDKSNVSRHIKNIFEEGEIKKDSTVAKNATVERQEGDRFVKRELDVYSLDIILAIGFRARSTKKAIYFRKKAGEILKQHITQGYTINQKMLDEKKDLYLQAINDIQKIASQGDLVSTNRVLDIIKSFSGTWFSLQSYDEGTIPNSGFTSSGLEIDIHELYADVASLKKELEKKDQATELFAQEKTHQALQGIIGNVMQTAFGNDVYQTLEEKAAHLLYFVIKNHPFNDGNKRTGAFVFLWFLRKSGIDFKNNITPQALTALTLLVAQSDPNDKDRIVGLILLMFQK
jgi:death-on-curing family protein